MSIASQIKEQHAPQSLKRMTVCEKLAVSVKIEDGHFKVYTFEDGSTVEVYIS